MNFDIESIKRKMLVKYPFFGSVVVNVDYIENKDISTAATDGKVIYYNPEFLEKLSVPEQTFVFVHEVCHIAFDHILRSEGKEETAWNIATDAVINSFLKKDGLKMPERGVDIEDAINYDAEELYEKLLKDEKQNNNLGQPNPQTENNNEKSQSSNGQGCGAPSSSNEQEQKSNQGESNNSPNRDSNNNSSSQTDDKTSNNEENDVGHDTHSMWKDAIKKYKEENKNEVEDKEKTIKQISEKDGFKKNLEEKKKELEKLKKELSQQAMGQGSSTNSSVRNISDIGKATPLIDWRYVLKEAIKFDVDWSYKNATIENGVISAALEEQPMPETEIVLDTSGSINETLLKNFLRECKNILQHSRLKVGCFDTKFYGFNEIRTEEDIENMEFIGGGGTNFDVAVGAFSKRIENKIIFTDGRAPMPHMPLDAIWIVFGETNINPKGGKVIKISNEQLEKLYSCGKNSLNRR